MKRALSVLAAVCAATGVAACGSTPQVATPAGHVAAQKAGRLLTHPATANKPIATHDVIVPQAIACPAGHATMGCSVQPSLESTDLARSGGVPGPKFPDVSSYQGHPDWQAAKQWGIWGAVAKLGEYSLDPDVGYNVGQFRALHIRWAVYLFVRPQGCTTEAHLALGWLRQIGGPSTSGPPLILDEEVPGLAGYATCIDAAIFRVYHRHVVIYTAPGTWSGGSGGGLDAWLASYGPSSPPACPWGCHVAAFQYTDGQFGFPTYIPGVGNGDVSVSYSLFHTTAPKPPAQKVRCYGHHATPNSARCRFVRAQIAGWQTEDQHVHRNWINLGIQARELRCRTPYKRTACRTFGQIGPQLAAAASTLQAEILTTGRRYGK